MTDENEVLAGMEAEFDGEEQTPAMITPVMMSRRLVWDLVPHGMAPDTIKALNLPGVSDDVENAEHGMAHAREFHVVPLLPVIWQLCEQIAVVQLETIRQVNPDVDRVMDEESFFGIAFTSVKAVITELLDLDGLHLPHFEYVLPVDEAVPTDEEVNGGGFTFRTWGEGDTEDE